MPNDDPFAAYERFRQSDEPKRRHAGNGTAGSQDHPRFVPLRFKDIKLGTDRPYLIKGLIPREGLTIVWGPPKCGKSFWVFDAMMHVALGRDYRGRRVAQGPVVYVACEGERGLAARVEAYRQTHLSEGDDPPFYLLTTRLDLAADVDQLVIDVRAALGTDTCAAIVIDTLNRSIAGSESRDEDMGAYVKAADRLREAFSAAVIIIHHCGINDQRPRGHTSLTGAAEAQIAVKRDDGDRIIATVEYMKDGVEGDMIASCLAAVDIGLDDEGDVLTSCIVEPAEHAPPPKRSKSPILTAAAKIALNTLRKAVNEAGEPAPASNHIPPNSRIVSVETWRRYYYTGTASDGRKKDARKVQFQRDRSRLQAAGMIGLHDDLCWIIADA